MFPGWHSVSTRESVAPGKARFMSCRRTRASAPTRPRRAQSWWEYWERWTRVTAETCSCTIVSLACSAMKRLASQVQHLHRVYDFSTNLATRLVLIRPYHSFQRCSSDRTALMTSSLACTTKLPVSLFSTRRGCWRPALTTLSAIPISPASVHSPSSSFWRARYAHFSLSVLVALRQRWGSLFHLLKLFWSEEKKRTSYRWRCGSDWVRQETSRLSCEISVFLLSMSASVEWTCVNHILWCILFHVKWLDKAEGANVLTHNLA